MSCAEFHKELPYLFESSADLTHAHLNTCENCASLVQDLRYIADQAKLLLPMHDPSPRVWNNIQASLAKENVAGLNTSAGRSHVTAQKKNDSFLTWGWAAAIAAALLVSFTVIQRTNSGAVPQPTQVPSLEAFSDQQDEQLIAEVQQRSPALKPVYESNLKNVNNYIAEVRATLAQDPNDDDVRGHLRQAYAQKAMLYRMATVRSLQ